MTKNQLREAVRIIVRRKLQEYVTISHGENGKVIDAISEDGSVSSASVPAVQQTTNSNGKQLSQLDQKKVTDLESQKAEAQDVLEKTKGELAKKTKPYTDRINKLEKRIGDLSIATDRIKR